MSALGETSMPRRKVSTFLLSSLSSATGLVFLLATAIPISRGQDSGTPALTVASSVAPGRYLGTISCGGLERRYVLYIPHAAVSRGPVPLVVALHGSGGNADAFLDESNWSTLAVQYGFILVAPDGLPVLPNLPSTPGLLNPQVWNSGQFNMSGGRSKIDDVAFIVAMIDNIAACCPINLRRVYAAGYSTGGAMAFKPGCRACGSIRGDRLFCRHLLDHQPPPESADSDSRHPRQDGSSGPTFGRLEDSTLGNPHHSPGQVGHEPMGRRDRLSHQSPARGLVPGQRREGRRLRTGLFRECPSSHVCPISGARLAGRSKPPTGTASWSRPQPPRRDAGCMDVLLVLVALKSPRDHGLIPIATTPVRVNESR